MIPGLEALACGPLAVPEDVMAHVVQVESSRNPFAIGVVGGRLLRQPRNLAEAVATVRMLESRGYNYSIGLAQVNRVNFARFGLETPEKGFDACNNLVVGSKILAECLQQHGGRWGDAFSCYYSGNPRTGYEHGYVQKVFASMGAAPPLGEAGEGPAIPLASDTGASTLPAPPAGQAVSRDAVPDVIAARVTAPDARRTQAIVADAALVPDAALAAAPLPPPTPAAPATTPPVDAPPPRAPGSGSSETTDAAPEARFLAEVRARMDTEAAAVDAPVPVATPVAGTDASADSQQVSKRQVSDAARVF